ncbi:MAG TPA: hypothetical protein VK154_03550 [Chitinophagales bacterium]|nr:hypothetical protein [Chitinophagales bacterium]
MAEEKNKPGQQQQPGTDKPQDGKTPQRDKQQQEQEQQDPEQEDAELSLEEEEEEDTEIQEPDTRL